MPSYTQSEMWERDRYSNGNPIPSISQLVHRIEELEEQNKELISTVQTLVDLGIDLKTDITELMKNQMLDMEKK